MLFSMPHADYSVEQVSNEDNFLQNHMNNQIYALIYRNKHVQPKETDNFWRKA